MTLADSYGRVATDLRVSLTDRCNLRCAYCMPPEGLDWLPAPEQLTDDEVVRLVRVGGQRLGIRHGRVTGRVAVRAGPRYDGAVRRAVPRAGHPGGDRGGVVTCEGSPAGAGPCVRAGRQPPGGGGGGAGGGSPGSGRPGRGGVRRAGNRPL